VRREKAALSSGCKSHPANAPAGSNRSSHGGDEMAEAFGVAGHVLVDPIDEMIRIVGDSVTDPAHQANAPKFPDRRRRPHGRR